MLYAQPEKQAKIPCINWWRILWALGFHQEQMETMEDSTEISGKIRIRKEEYLRIGFVSNFILFT